MNKTTCLLTLFIFFTIKTVVLAQESPVDYAVITKIKQEGLHHSGVMETLFNITEVNGPRLTGSAGLKTSQQWIIKQLLDWGITNPVIEPWGNFGRGWEVQKSYIAITSPYYQSLIGIPKAWTSGTAGLIKSNVVLIKTDSLNDLEQYKGKLNGKIVVFGSEKEIKLGLSAEAKRYSDEELKSLFMSKKAEEDHDEISSAQREKFRNARQARQKINAFLADEHPGLILNSRGGTMGTFFTTNGASYAKDAKETIPELEMSSEHFNRFVRLLEKNMEVTAEAEIITSFSDKDSIQYNVIAEIPGTDKKLKSEVVMIGAHLDSWHAATGATDNAAGCAVMMEVMRILKVIGINPRRTIRIALWSGEEQGLLGSKGYVKNHFGDAETMLLKPEHEKLSAYYNLDNGGGKIRGIYLQENEALRPLFEAWFQPFHDMGATTVTNKSTGSTDHIPFDHIGLTGLQFIQDPLDYFNKTHHTNMDTYDRIQEEDLKQAAVIVASIVYETAMRNEKLPRKKLPEIKPK